MKKVSVKAIILIIAVVCTWAIAMPVYADSSTSSTDVETVSIPADMLTDEQKAELAKRDIETKVEMYGQWVGLGKEIGTAVDESLGSLTYRANEFANTKVGNFTMFLVAYKVLGTDALQIIIGIPLFILVLTIWIISFYRNCIPHRIVVKKSGPFWAKVKEYSEAGEDDTEYGGQRWAYVLVLVIMIGICCLVLFS